MLSAVPWRQSPCLLVDYDKLSLFERNNNNFFVMMLYFRQTQQWHQLREGSKVTSPFLPSYTQRPSVSLQNREKNVRGNKIYKKSLPLLETAGQTFQFLQFSPPPFLFFLVRVWLLIMRCPGFYSTYFYLVLHFIQSLWGSQRNGIHRLQTV